MLLFREFQNAIREKRKKGKSEKMNFPEKR